MAEGPPADAPDEARAAVRYAVGVGLSSRAEPAELAALVDEALRAAGVSRDRIRVVATVDSRAGHPALGPLGWPVVTFPTGLLSAAARGTAGPAVAEPAALLAAGPGAVLVVPKRRSARATVAVARADLRDGRQQHP